MSRLAVDLARGLDPVALCRDGIGMTPDKWQADVMRSDHPRILLNCCRQSGKSFNDDAGPRLVDAYHVRLVTRFELGTPYDAVADAPARHRGGQPAGGGARSASGSTPVSTCASSATPDRQRSTAPSLKLAIATTARSG